MKWSEDFFAESCELQSWNMALLCECQGISRTAMKKVLFLSAFALTTALFFNLSETDCYVNVKGYHALR